MPARAPAQQWDCRYGAHQKWTFTHTGIHS
ncbi:RICIN domain-containing protein [Streptomyces sp. NPDC101160]